MEWPDHSIGQDSASRRLPQLIDEAIRHLTKDPDEARTTDVGQQI